MLRRAGVALKRWWLKRVKAARLGILASLRRGSWLRGWPDWVSLLLAFLALGVAVHSVEKAEWIIFQPSLVLTLLFSVLTTAVFARSRLPNSVKQVVISLLGAIVAGWQLSQIPHIQPWWESLALSQPNQSTVHFTTLLIIATWIVGHISAWSVLCRRNVWVTVLLGTVIVIVNLTNLPREYYYFLPLYVLAAALLVGQMTLAKDQRTFGQRNQPYPGRGVMHFAGIVAVLGIVLALVTLLLPDVRLTQLGPTLNTRTFWLRAEKYWLNIFAPVPAKWFILRSDRQGELLFKASQYKDDSVQFIVNSDETDYWRNRRYHTYLSWGWTSNSTIDNMFYPGKQVYATERLQGQELTYTMISKLRTDVLLTTGEFKTSRLPVLLQTLSHTGGAESPEKRRDVISVVAPRILQPDERYTMTVELPQITAEELSQASTEYDEWITETYLQLPDTLPRRVRELSQRVTRAAKNPYEKVKAIGDFLLSFGYTREITPPPPGIDAVDFFLFTLREGDCTYFASATAVMLRAVGVPARISSGYLVRGQDDAVPGQIVLRARDYHTRTEVYFPGYGWVEFETTPGISADLDYIPSVEEMPNLDDFSLLDVLGGGGELEDISSLVQSPASSAKGVGRLVYLPAIWFGSMVLLFLLAAAVFLYQQWFNSLRRTGSAAYVYAKMCSLASRSRAGPRAVETPTEYAARLASALPGESPLIRNIVQAYTESRFSPRRELDPTQKVKLEKSWVQLYPALVRRIVRFGR